MKKRNFAVKLTTILYACSTFIACSDDMPATGTENNGDNITAATSKYVIAAKTQDATYLVTAESLEEGTVTSLEKEGCCKTSGGSCPQKRHEILDGLGSRNIKVCL